MEEAGSRTEAGIEAGTETEAGSETEAETDGEWPWWLTLCKYISYTLAMMCYGVIGYTFYLGLMPLVSAFYISFIYVPPIPPTYYISAL